ncbi:MAG TPA: TetR/AcrR family transcriptional regulator [Gammaproteobacteria bacterium]|uniref:TetR/AcrR family transcriptional regulator n=1 Tax=Immundisolibacter sp. TaxID=1934948 RepID=UPI000E83392F|nr:TetR/AcrR family transcriptional regulator [Gammaproteobacteria bacterium]HCZ47447.1 TetR/AcrR family transcriptional regulator [Gammaproteobacteria bacterium]MCH76885.1 TetR/AcrR family transcriptional regulator [Gammaproteobacteria bacterium]
MTNPSPPKPCAAAAHRVLRAAAEIFSSQGYDAASISAIAKRADVSKANIFHHFKSKAALYQEVLKNACRSFTDSIDAVSRLEEDGIGRLNAYARMRLCDYIEDPMSSRLVLRALTSDCDESDIQPVRDDFAASFHRLVELIRAGQTAGQLRADVNPALIAVLVNAGNVFYAQTRPLLRHFQDIDFADDPHDYSAQMMDILTRGIAAG